MGPLLEPKEIELPDQSGKLHKFIISKFSAFDGREICTQYPMSALPKLGDYKANEEILQKIVYHATRADIKEVWVANRRVHARLS